MTPFSADALLISGTIAVHGLLTVVAMIVMGRGFSAVSAPLNQILNELICAPWSRWEFLGRGQRPSDVVSDDRADALERIARTEASIRRGGPSL